MARRLLLTSIVSTALAMPLAWARSAQGTLEPVMKPVFQAVHNVTNVSIKILRDLYSNTNFDDAKTLQIPVPDRSRETPIIRLDKRTCTPHHLQAISDFIDACHSKKGKGKVGPPLHLHT